MDGAEERDEDGTVADLDGLNDLEQILDRFMPKQDGVEEVGFGRVPLVEVP